MKTKKMLQVVCIIILIGMTLSSCGFGAAATTENISNNDSANDGGNNQSYESPSNQGRTDDGIIQNSPDMEESGAGEAVVEMDAVDGITIEPMPMPTQPFIQVPSPENTFFEDYGVNPFVETIEDPLSTFSMDVDTGSYTIARNYIMDGFAPPEEAVRIEEFINYFPQGYPYPFARDTFSLTLDGAPSPFTETDFYHVMRVGVQGYDVPAEERRPVSLTFVIDVSGSMATDNRLALVQQSLAILVEQLTEHDRVSIVAYSTNAWVVLEPTPGDQGWLIMSAINSLYPMDSTNAEQGLILGYDLASYAYLPGGVNRVILCSDGVANVGNTGADSIWERIQYQASEGITITTIGVGMGNYNDVLLEQLADQGDGFYAYIDTLEEAERLFGHDLVSTLQVIAMDARIQVEFNAEVVQRYRLVGYENRDMADQDFRDNEVDAAEIGAGHNVTALYEIKLFSGAVGRIATVTLRWQNPDTHQWHEISQSISTYDLSDSFRLADPYFQMDVLVAEFAEILRNSYWAEGSLEDLLEYAERTTRLIDEPEFYELIEMIQQAMWLID